MKKIFVSFFMLFLATFIVGCDYLPTDKNKAQKAVKNVLIDPNSAMFSDVKEGVSANYVCGFVNSKNRMGGYVGSSPFIYNTKKEKLMLLSKWATDSTFQSYEFSLRYKNLSDGLKLMDEILVACKFPIDWSSKCGGSLINGNDAQLCPLYLKAYDVEEVSPSDRTAFITALVKRYYKRY